jgi:hypothetical protein
MPPPAALQCLSVVIPARDEEACLRGTLGSRYLLIRLVVWLERWLTRDDHRGPR